MSRADDFSTSAPTRRFFLMSAAALSGAAAMPAWATPSPAVDVTVYKTPTCGCCTAWVEHLKTAGFAPAIVERPDIGPVRTRLGAPDDLRSCHIAVFGRYIVEGHVPAASIAKLLEQKPDAVGLFVPGMPLGSPGMESPYEPQPYDVVLLRKDGTREVFDHYGV